MASTEIVNIMKQFDKFTQNPVNFLEVQSEAKDEYKSLVKSLYDFTKMEENFNKKSKSSALSKLIVEDFDEEQIWQQIELQNDDIWDQLINDVASCMTNKNDLRFPIDFEQEVEVEPKQKEKKKSKKQKKNKAKVIIEPEVKNNVRVTRNREKNSQKSAPKIKKSIVDDNFFKLDEMEQFLISEERKIDKQGPKDSDEESIDYFEGDDDYYGKDNEKHPMYDEFFENEDDEVDTQKNHSDDEESDNEDRHNDEDDSEDIESEQPVELPEEPKKQVRFSGIAETSSEDSEESENENPILNSQPLEKQSQFEQRQARLQQHIARLENKSLKEAPWQLKGEVDATKRPQNSLLEEIVDFDLTSRPAPIITEQTTFTLEDLIRRRIKDKAWDDVVRKAKPVEDQLVFRKPVILDQSKSKLSLAQVYEAEYLKQKHGGDEEEKEPEAHTVIRDSMKKLFAQLDALSHYHYTPKPAQPEVKIVSNTPAIQMEEVAPISMSNATLLAPEEVKKKIKGDLISKEERTETDKKRERRKKKKFQRERGVKEAQKEDKKKSEVNESDKSLKTSKAFFEHLNQNVNSLIRTSKTKRKDKGQ